MSIYNSTIDTYRATEHNFECRSCGTRTVTAEYLAACPDCGGSVRNIAVARE